MQHYLIDYNRRAIVGLTTEPHDSNRVRVLGTSELVGPRFPVPTFVPRHRIFGDPVAAIAALALSVTKERDRLSAELAELEAAKLRLDGELEDRIRREKD